MMRFLRVGTNPYKSIPQDEQFLQPYDKACEEGEDNIEEPYPQEAMGGTTPPSWYTTRAMQNTNVASQEASISTPLKTPLYPKVAPIMKEMGLFGEGGLGKEGQDITQPIEIIERPKGLSLGVDPDACIIPKGDITYTFVPPSPSIKESRLEVDVASTTISRVALEALKYQGGENLLENEGREEATGIGKEVVATTPTTRTTLEIGKYQGEEQSLKGKMKREGEGSKEERGQKKARVADIESKINGEEEI